MKSMMGRTTLREIRYSLGRYMAIFAIVALGVGFFAGLKVTKSAMLSTTREYWEDNQFYDYRLISTTGLEEEDVEFFAGQEGIRAAEGAVSFDIMTIDAAGTESVLKVHSLTSCVNMIELLAGRMPENGSECVVDGDLFEESQIGGTIVLAEDNEEEDLEKFAAREYTIVGIVRSPYYIQFDRGTTSLGNGRVSGFMYLPRAGFDVDYYTEVFLKFAEDFPLYSEAYSAFIEEQEGTWENLLRERADRRYTEVLAEAREELADARAEFEYQKADAEEELADAGKELADAEEEIKDGEGQLKDAAKDVVDADAEIAGRERELKDAEVTLAEEEENIREKEQELADGEQEWKDNKEKIDYAKWELNQNQSRLDEQSKELAAKETQLAAQEAALAEQEKELTASEKKLAAQEAALVIQEEELAAQEALLVSQEEELAAREADLEAAIAAGMLSEEETAAGRAEIAAGKEKLAEYREELENANQTLVGYRAELEAGKKLLAGYRSELKAGKQTLMGYRAELEAGKQTIAGYQFQIDEGRKAIADAEQQLSDAWQTIAEGREQIADGWIQIEEAKAEIAEGRTKISDAKIKLAEGKEELSEKSQELKDGKQEYEDGLKEYEEAYAEYIVEIAEAEQELKEAEQEIADLEGPDIYVLGRDTNVGYVYFENDSDIVEGIANVFPVFFFLVAALVCITTMNRMVEEQRTQIGVLKALGYGEAAIMNKYMFYSGSAALAGCVSGFILGTWLFPAVIWKAYGIMYNVGGLIFVFDIKLAIISLAVSLLCSIGTTWFSCRYELSAVAAELMRPKAPKAGKRVFLEYITVIWKHLKFLRKVSIRNLLRYKRRFLMMVIGISGCTALLVTGLGIKDSIGDVATQQFTEILIYDISVGFKETMDDQMQEKLSETLDTYSLEYTYVYAKTLDLYAGNRMKSLNMIIISREEDVGDFVSLHTTKDEPIPYPGPGEAVVTHKTAANLGIRIGDEILLRDENLQEICVTVSGICENFVYNYIYLNADTYIQQMGCAPEYKTAYVNLPEGADAHQTAAELMKMTEVSSVSINQDIQEHFTEMMSSLNYIVLVVIFCAAALAFIVLYNLTNINITERIREIATIKVLGFYKKETDSYVFRENMMLTCIGAAVGLPLGYFLHRFVMNEINIDVVAFDIHIKLSSYLFGLLLTFLFTWLVNRLMSRKLEGINMAESLKSVD